MDREPISTPASDHPLAGASRSRLRQLWQVPVFLLGLAAFIVVWMAEPHWREHKVDPLAGNLRAARKALASADPNPRQALALVQGVLESAERSPARAGAAHFLLGSSYALLAAEASAQEAPALWQQARMHLEKARSLGVSPADQPHLSFRLAKVWSNTGGDPQQIINALTSSLGQGADNPAEAYGLLAQAYLRLPKPDIAAALEANRQQLALPSTDERLLEPARLLRGELLLRLHQREEARLVLSCIKKSAPPALYGRACWLRAQSYQEDEQWNEAAKLWEEILKDREIPPTKPDQILYDLGICYWQMGRPTDAGSVWENALQYHGEGAQAAALRLAELHLHNRNLTPAWKAFGRALAKVGAAGYHNVFIPVSEARQICEDGCQTFRKMGEYDLSKKLARLYAGFAPAGTAQDLIGQACDTWAQTLQARARRAGMEESARTEEQAARAQLVEAGKAYEAAADSATTLTARADWLWRSGDRFTQAQDFTAALATLKKFLKLDLPPERLGEGWYALGLVHEYLGQEQPARAAFHQCIEIGRPEAIAFRARYQLAELEIARGKLDDAEAILKQNLDLMTQNPDSEAQENSLFALGNLLFRRGNYRVAAIRLQEMLERYPTTPRATAARLLLADCYRRLAAQESQNLRGAASWLGDPHSWDQYRHWLKMAAANYQKLKDDLLARQAHDALSAADEAMLRQAEFAEAECCFDLGSNNFEDAIRLYGILAVRYHDRAEGLDALTQITRCYWIEQQPVKALQTLDRIAAALRDMDDAALAQSATFHTRHEWEAWLVKAREWSTVP